MMLLREKVIKMDKQEKRELKETVRERNEAFTSLDREKILAYMERNGMTMPRGERMLWASVHMARLGIKTMSEEEKEKSRQWLRENGLSAGK